MSKEPPVIIAYKGFTPTADGGLQCRDLVYREGETYEHDGPIALCEQGIHATLMPLHVLRYYSPAKSEYHVVELAGVSDERKDDDTKVVARKIKIGAKLTLAGLIEAQVQYVTERAKPFKGSTSKLDNGAATASGESGAATASGQSGAATASGRYGAATASGWYGAATASGEKSTASAAGKNGNARGAIGAALFLAERDANWNIVHVAAVIVGQEHDGITIEPDVFYTLRGGRVEVAR